MRMSLANEEVSLIFTRLDTTVVLFQVQENLEQHRVNTRLIKVSLAIDFLKVVFYCDIANQ